MRMAATSSIYRLVDIGANMAHPSLQKDYADVLSRAKQSGIVKLMITGTSEKSTEEACKLARAEPNFLYYTAGVHPHDAKHFVDGKTLDFLRSHLQQNNTQCVAVGECGLDFNRNFSPREQQLDVFEKQVELACKLQKPLFIHEREASTEMVEILCRHRQTLPPTVIHCFTGTCEEAKCYIEMGLYIGLTGFLWKDRAPNSVKQALQQGLIPKERLLLETDAPYMYPKVNDKKLPAGIRAKLTEQSLSLHKYSSFERNEPSSLAATCELIAAFMDVPAEELAQMTTENAHRVFRLGNDKDKHRQNDEENGNDGKQI